jgi:uncharacterized protein YwlG (UPF0340 family)
MSEAVCQVRDNALWMLDVGSTDVIGSDVGVWAGMIVTTYVGGPSLEKIASRPLALASFKGLSHKNRPLTKFLSMREVEHGTESKMEVVASL